MSGAPTFLSKVLVPAVPLYNGGSPLDLISLSDFKDELDIEGSRHDRWIRGKIARASQTISTYCSRTFQVQSYQERIWPYRDPYPWQLPANIAVLQLAAWPIANVPSTAGIAPPQAPSLSSVGGGTGSAQRFYVRISYVTGNGETAASLESDLLVGAGDLLSVASPDLDRSGQAMGWNCYIAMTPNVETLQNIQPLPIGTAFALPLSGLVAGAPLPPYIFVAEHGLQPFPLAEGRDFVVKPRISQIERLFIDGYVRKWPVMPIIVEYRAGFETIPGDLKDAATELVKLKWFARHRDPMVRSEDIQGVYTANYWLGTGPGGEGDLPASTAAAVERYRVPVIA